jgi:hypothetical protein
MKGQPRVSPEYGGGRQWKWGVWKKIKGTHKDPYGTPETSEIKHPPVGIRLLGPKLPEGRGVTPGVLEMAPFLGVLFLTVR